MEDDCVFREGTVEYIDKAFSNLPDDWEILLGGASTVSKVKYNEYWDKVKFFTGGHFMILNSSIYDRYLKLDKTELVDRWLSKQDFSIYITNKVFVTQAAGFSNQVNKEVDYTSYFNKLELL
jgi:hypothetical protein